MRNTIRHVSVIGLALIGALLLAANAAAQTAKIVKIVGSDGATVVIGGQSEPAHEQMEVPQNAQINTTSGQEVYVEVVSGVVASIKPNSQVIVNSLTGPTLELELRQGSLVSQIDKARIAGKTYGVRTARGVAAARGTAFSVSVSNNGFSIASTADSVTFTSSAGTFTIQAGMISITPPGATTPEPPISLATAVLTNPQVAGIVREAVTTVTTVVQNNLGQMSAESATNVISQVVAVAVAAVPAEATTFTSQAITAVTASGSATASTPEAAANAAGSVTAAAVKSAPDQAAQLAGAAAQAAPAQTGVITAAAQQVAPESAKDGIVQQVASSTGQSTNSVQSSATAAATTATNAVNTSNEATANVVTPPSTPSTSSTPVTSPQNTPSIPPTQPDVSGAGA